MPATYEPISTTTLSGNSTTINFNSIPSTYTDLRLILTTGVDISGNDLRMRFNSDSATNYSQIGFTGNGSTTNTSDITSFNAIRLTGNAPQTPSELIIIDIFSYLAAVNKTVLITDACDKGGGSGNVWRISSLWRSTSAITSINLFAVNPASFLDSSVATLYGILRA